METTEVRATQPGLEPARLARLIESCVQQSGLDLTGSTVLTEAGTGAYAVTPVIAALAGATVTAITADSRFGSAAQAAEAALDLAERLGVRSRLTVTEDRTPSMFAAADIITNSGHLRPIVGAFADAIRTDAVLPLMFEAWELDHDRTDLDLQRLAGRGVRMAGTNERHPLVDVFSYLGLMAVTQLADAGVPAYGSRIALVCDNPFLPYLQHALAANGAAVSVLNRSEDLLGLPEQDAVLVSIQPTGTAVLAAETVRALAQRWPTVVVCQFWGDIDRDACSSAGLSYWPPSDPGRGHMGVLPSRVGPEPIVRLQTGGLKVGQILRLDEHQRTSSDREWLDVL
jgi:hypothetical protein